MKICEKKHVRTYKIDIDDISSPGMPGGYDSTELAGSIAGARYEDLAPHRHTWIQPTDRSGWPYTALMNWNCTPKEMNILVLLNKLGYIGICGTYHCGYKQLQTIQFQVGFHGHLLIFEST